jgi:hypothetical protein
MRAAIIRYAGLSSDPPRRYHGAMPKVRRLLLLCLLLPGAAPAPQDLDFRLQYLPVHGRRQATLTYDMDGDGRGDIVNLSIDFEPKIPERWVAIHLLRDGRYATEPDHLFALSDRASALVFGDFLPGGGTELGFLAEDGVWVHPWTAEGPAPEPVQLLHVPTFFRTPSLKQMPVWQWRMDFSGDGLDDLIVPLEDGYRVYFQTAPGVFGKVARLEEELAEGSSKVLAVSDRAEAPEYVPAHLVSFSEMPRVEPVDINGDGLMDLVVIRKDAATYFLQKAPGEFASTRPWRVTYGIPTLKEEAKKDAVNLGFIKFVDVNADKMADLVVTRIEGQLGLWDSIRTNVYIHLGNGKGNFVADKRIAIDGVSIDPEFIDMNGDGFLDVVTSRLRTDLMKQAVDAVILGDVALSYEVFQFDPARGGFMPDPVYEKRIFVRREDLSKTGAGAVPLVFVRGDLSGDGRPDLLVVDPKQQELRIHPGRERDTGSARLIDFDGTAHWRIPLERHPKGLQVMDVNSDGLADVVLYYHGVLGLALARRGR